MRRTLAAQTVPTGRAVRLARHDWSKLARGKVDSTVT
jgi:hypothetical protein